MCGREQEARIDGSRGYPRVNGRMMKENRGEVKTEQTAWGSEKSLRGRGSLGGACFRGIHALLARFLEVSWKTGATRERLGRGFEMRRVLVGDSEEIEICGIFLVIHTDGLFEFNDGLGIVALAKINKAEAAVGHGQNIIFARIEFLVGNVNRLL